jgi:predicted metal-dependent phosphoesterase TrpH
VRKKKRNMVPCAFMAVMGIKAQGNTMQTLKVEFHCHSIYSKDSLIRPQALVDAARRAGLDRLIVTDHNSTGGALETQRIDPQLVIVGEEIMTTRGELLAAFVREEIPAGLEPGEAIRRLRAQGAFISVSHPFDLLRNGHWEQADLLHIAPLVDAIETFNARCMDARPNLAAQEFASQHNLPGTVGSDAHTAREVGRANLMLAEFSDAEGLRRVIRGGVQVTRLSSPLIHITSRYAVILKKLGIVRRPGK